MSGLNEKRSRINYANKFALILFVALIVNMAFYWLPDTIFGVQLKKVDMLSDIREPLDEDDLDLIALFPDDDDFYEDKPSFQMPADVNFYPVEISPDSNFLFLSRISSAIDGTLDGALEGDSIVGGDISADAIAVDGANKAVDDDNTNYLFNTDIEDFTSGRTGLRRFFAALNNIDNLERPVRIAFVGDSFIEGDIIVADFREKMQTHFGGRGVGLVPIASNVTQYRPTIKQSADGWSIYSIIKNRSKKHVISGLLFEPTSGSASVNFQTVDVHPRLKEVSSLKFIYSKNESADILLKSNADSSFYRLPPTGKVTQLEVKGDFNRGTLQFKNAKGLNAIGIALEDNHGVVVDNFSLRGNSGLVMSEVDGETCRELQRIRPYDLIVLQYGLNVASDSVRNYSWYGNKMVAVIEHIQSCFPGADILLLGVSDRSRKRGGAYSTMPAVVSLLRAQRQTAKNAEVTFWSIFAAMGGQNSMVNYVNSNWASKDYTHLNMRGGREIANALYDAIITEKEMYDGDERLVER